MYTEEIITKKKVGTAVPLLDLAGALSCLQNLVIGMIIAVNKNTLTWPLCV